MKVVQIQFTPWDKVYNFDPVDSILATGDYVVVKTELGIEIGRVTALKELSDQETGQIEIKPILRKATTTDINKIADKKQKKEALNYCKEMASKYKLPMKLVDVHYAFDGSHITFAFIADGRIDFRELVKELTRHFSRTIRLQQIGIRDEAKLVGDHGHCGRSLCCGNFLKNLSSITSEMAELQQLTHRGSERISGICGRLMCCLAYEENGYEELAKNLPTVGNKIKVEGKEGRVVCCHILKQSVDVEFRGANGEGNTVVEVQCPHKK